MTDQIKKEVVYMHNLTKKGCPFIVKLVDHFEDDDNVYLIMEYVKGVGNRLRRDNSWTSSKKTGNSKNRLWDI